jgi:cell division septum initiation protein DivIVA
MIGNNNAMLPGITEEIIARQPPEAQAIIRALLAEIAELKARVEELERQVKGKTPQNSSLPPSSQHPHARPQTAARLLVSDASLSSFWLG